MDKTTDEFDENTAQFISETHRGLFKERRQYEWRILTATVTLLVLAVAGKYTGKLVVPDTALAWLAVWLITGFLCWFSISYLVNLHRAHQINKLYAEEAEKFLIERTSIRRLRAVQRKFQKTHRAATTKRNWALCWQMTIIIAFGLFSACLLAPWFLAWSTTTAQGETPLAESPGAVIENLLMNLDADRMACDDGFEEFETVYCASVDPGARRSINNWIDSRGRSKSTPWERDTNLLYRECDIDTAAGSFTLLFFLGTDPGLTYDLVLAAKPVTE